MSTLYLKKLRGRQKAIREEQGSLSFTIRALNQSLNILKSDELKWIKRYRKLGTDLKISKNKENKELERLREKNKDKYPDPREMHWIV